MLYASGTKIDLTYLNTKKAVASQPKKSTAESVLHNAYEPEAYALYQVGTRLTYNQKTGRWGRRIPVDYA